MKDRKTRRDRVGYNFTYKKVARYVGFAFFIFLLGAVLIANAYSINKVGDERHTAKMEIVYQNTKHQ